MVGSLLITLRLAAAALIAGYGVAKLTELPRSALELWRPRWIPGPLMLVGVLTVALVEVSDLGVIGLGGLSWSVTSAFVAPQAVLLTGYGLVALNHRQSCGCGGVATGTQESKNVGRRLVARNLLLFGGGLLGAVAQPAAWRAPHVDLVVLEMSLLPFVSFVALLGWRLTRANSLRPSASRDGDRALLFARLAQHV